MVPKIETLFAVVLETFMLMIPYLAWHTKNVTAFPVEGDLLVIVKYCKSITLTEPLVAFLPAPVTQRTMGTLNKSMQKCFPCPWLEGYTNHEHIV